LGFRSNRDSLSCDLCKLYARLCVFKLCVVPNVFRNIMRIFDYLGGCI
jgi:hypothetical protein